jgi:hypothetical protein
MKKQLLVALCALTLACTPVTMRALPLDPSYLNDAKLIACVSLTAATAYFAHAKKCSVLKCVVIAAITHSIVRSFVAIDKEGKLTYKGEMPLPNVHRPLIPLKYTSDIIAQMQKSITEAKAVNDAKNILALYAALA